MVPTCKIRVERRQEKNKMGKNKTEWRVMRQGQNLRLYRSLAALSPVNPFLFLPCFRPFPTFSFLFLAIFDPKLREKREKCNIIPNSLGPKRENGSGPKFSSLKIPLVPRSSRSASRYFRFISGWHLATCPFFFAAILLGQKWVSSRHGQLHF